MHDQSFSVLISVFLRDNHLLFDLALKSIFRNSIQPNEVVLIVDGPITKEIESIISKYANEWPKLLKVYRLKNNMGLFFALNYGIKKINSYWVVRADSDDINHRNRFENLMRFSSRGYDVIGSGINEVDNEGNFLRKKSSPEKHKEICAFALRRNPINHMSVMFKKNIFMEVGGYPDLYFREDYGLWVKLIAHGAIFYNIQMELVDANIANGFLNRRGGIRYAFAEIKLQSLMSDLGLKSRFSAFFDGSLRTFVFLLPSFLRGKIYMHLLR